MCERGHWKPILMSPVYCPERSDGSLSWPTCLGYGYTVVRDYRTVPKAYLNLPKTWIAVANCGSLLD